MAGFHQQGQVDWIGLLNTTVKCGIGLIERLFMFNVDETTLVIARDGLAPRFRMPFSGQRRMSGALSKLKSCSSVGKALWFGFGVKHLIWDLAQSERGLTCLALCASLTEVFSLDTSAAILAKIAEQLEVPQDRRPSLDQWNHLVGACEGTLALTTFSSEAENFINLAYNSERTVKDRLLGEPDEVARALIALGELSHGSIASISLHGGACCGWIAAFGSSFLGVEVEIKSGNRPDVCLFPPGGAKNPSLLITFTNEACLDPMLVENRSTTYFIHDISSDLFQCGAEETIFCGRVPWETALKRAYGASADTLLGTDEFGILLGAAARIFEAISPAGAFTGIMQNHFLEPGLEEVRSGSGYLQLAGQRLPELQKLLNKATTSSIGSLRSALSAFYDAQITLCAICGCWICGSVRQNQTDFTIALGRSGQSENLYCLPLLAQIFVKLVWDLSSVELDTTLQPSLVGLQALYAPFYGGNIEPISIDDKESFLRQNSPTFGFDRFISSMKPASIRDTVRVLTGASSWASAPKGQGQQYQPCAFSMGGLCFYYEVLKQESLKLDRIARLHVIPGRIQTEGGKVFDQVHDLVGGNNVLPMLPSMSPFTLAGTRATEEGRVRLSKRLLVRERSNSLEAALRIADPRRSVDFDVPITRLLASVLNSAGVVACNSTGYHNDCGVSTLSGVYELNGHGTVNTDALQLFDRPVVVRSGLQDDVGRALALYIHQEWKPLHHSNRHRKVILGKGQCLSCCIRSAKTLHDADPQLFLFIIT
jgi:hypothetical protein